MFTRIQNGSLTVAHNAVYVRNMEGKVIDILPYKVILTQASMSEYTINLVNLIKHGINENSTPVKCKQFPIYLESIDIKEEAYRVIVDAYDEGFRLYSGVKVHAAINEEWHALQWILNNSNDTIKYIQDLSGVN